MKKLTAVALFLLFLCSSSKADTRYVLVRSELNVRSRASVGSEVHGRLFVGDCVEVTRTYRDWCFLENLPSEEGCGWVSSQYLVSSKVTEYHGELAVIAANGRVAMRDSVEGKRKNWAHPGDTVHVYGVSDVWSVTDRGYVKTEYLSFE